MTPALLLALLIPAAPPPAYRLVVKNGAETAWVELTVRANGRPLWVAEADLLAGYKPTADGSDPLDRLVGNGRLLRVDHLPLDPYTVPVTAALFAALDRNGDGKLQARELRTAGEALLARFDADDDGCLIPLEIVPDLPTAGSPLPPPGPASPTLSLIQPGDPAQPAGPPAARLDLRADSAYHRRVTAAGVVLDVVVQPRAARPAVPRSLTRPGRERERARFEAVAAEVATLGIRPQARGLFDRLDADGDGQLSVRELRAAPDRLAGVTATPEAPEFCVTLSAGTACRPPHTRSPLPVRGPVWFAALDRNGDGDVSRREFVGTAAQFEFYDADGDGLISADEAEAGGVKIRRGIKP